MFAWLTILAVARGLGIPYAFVRFIPEYQVSEDAAKRQRLVRYARIVAVASAVAVAILGAVVIGALAPAGVSLDAVALGMATVPLLAVLTLQSELARGFRRVVLAYLPLLVLRPLFTLALGVAVLAATGHLTATRGLAAGLVALVVCLIAQRGRVRRLLGTAAGATARARADRVERREWLRVALPLMLINLLAAIALRADVIVVGISRGSHAAGVYAVAARVALLSTFALEALNTIVAPTIARLYFGEQHAALQRLVRSTARVTFAASLAVTLALELAGTKSLELFGPGYAGGIAALQILLIGQLVNASTGQVTYLMIATGEQNLAALAQTVATVLFLVSALVLTAYWGLVGTALAVTLGRATINVWMVIAAQRRLRVRSFVL
jgi:O-antigen/teichoic acid export membrane protein